MGDFVASRSMRMLDDLKAKDEDAFNWFQDGVTKLVSLLNKIEKSLNRCDNSAETIRRLNYTIEDILEKWVLTMETADMDSKIEKKRITTRPFKRWLLRNDDGKAKSYSEDMSSKAEFMNMRIQKLFPEDETELEITEAEIASSAVTEANHQRPRQIDAHAVDENQLEKKNGDLDELVSVLTDQENEHRVVSICGVEGLGKTTLATKLYKHPPVRSHFKGFAWVDLTPEYQMGSLAEDILNQLTAEAEQMSVAEEEEKKKVAEDPPAIERKESLMKESAPEKSEGAENGKLRRGLKKLLKTIGKGFYAEDSAEPPSSVQMSVAKEEEQKKGSEEKKRGAEESLMKESAPEKSEGAENAKLRRGWKKARAKVQEKIGKGALTSGLEGTKEGEKEEPQPNSSEQIMMDKLKGILEQRRFLLVIDGISKPSQWSKIKSEFITEDMDTKILLTTDDEITAGGEGYQGYQHHLKPLTAKESWELLQKNVFHGKRNPDSGVVPKLGKAMASECGGLPSKISSLGRILSKLDFGEWHQVNDDVNGYLKRENYQIRPNPTMSNDHPVSRYDDLSYHLKQCFLYLAIFKGSEGVDQEDLSILWMAEGIAPPPPHKQGESVMATTKSYLLNLHKKGMLLRKLDEVSLNKGFERIFLSDDARELSLYNGDKERFGLKVMDFSERKLPRFDSLSLDNTTRRLVIHFDEHSSTWEYDFDLSTNLRSLLFINSSEKYVDLPVPSFGNYKFKAYSLLRVVHFVRCKFEDRKLPEGIAELSNLRYLGVLYCDLDRLPTSLSNLRNLQVLNVRAYDDARITIPHVIISQLVGLKHLRLPNNLDHKQSHPLKLKLDLLKDLETLIGFNADIHDINSLSQLQKLRHLEIHASSNDSLRSIIDFVESNGARVRTSLFLGYKCDFTSPEGYDLLEEVLMCPNLDALTFFMVPIHKFPNCGKFASKDIAQINLIGCKLSEDPMEALGKFPNLRILCLGYGAFVGRKMRVGDGGFPELTYLEFRCLPNLEGLSVGKGAMKKLSDRNRKFMQCPNFKGIPQESAVDSSLNNSVMKPAPPSAITGDCEIDAHHIFSWHHILKALGSFILYLSRLNNRSRNTNCQVMQWNEE